ncbi:MAG: S-methyl-5-thioribose-1-phosphate isomerase [Tissierellia bacterium]|nr:S-methyl-5-thioribose-1-phosphate isomerase [Tissierellia bacterium]
MLKTIEYRDEKLYIIDQTKLPTVNEIIAIETVEECFYAIKKLKVRGAPAIGIAAAYGIVLGIKDFKGEDFGKFYNELKKISKYLGSSRPTAVNLFWALDRMEKKALENKEKPIAEIKKILVNEAISIQREDEEICRRIGENGIKVLKDGYTVLTHCNAGVLATSKYGTALAPIYYAQEKGWNVKVFADETRPLLQGSRLTAFELMEAGVDVTLITDNMAAMVMSKGWIDVVIVGCDRIAANGDVANKIGTYGVALLAKAHNIPFYIAGPTTTIDLNTPTGEDIVIEERDREEIICGFGKQTAPSDVKVYNPAFDVTPHELIDGIITEKGIVRAPYDINLKKLFK